MLTKFEVGQRVRWTFKKTWVEGLYNNVGTVISTSGNVAQVLFDKPTRPSGPAWYCEIQYLELYKELTPFERLVQDYIDGEMKELQT